MTVNIYDLANQLEREIRQLPDFQAAVVAKAQIEEDAEANAIWQEFVAGQAKLQEMMQTGQFPSQEEQEKIQSLGQQIESNDLLKSYFGQQHALAITMADLEKIVFAPMRELLK